jgi:CBS domain-containing protein
MAQHETVDDVMTRNPIALPETAPALEAARKMRDAGIGDVVMLNGNVVAGIVTDRDIVVRCVAEGRDPRSTTLGEIASRELTTMAPGDKISTAVRLMRERAIRRLLVVKDGRPVGIFTIGDLAVQDDPDSALAAVSAARPNV